MRPEAAIETAEPIINPAKNEVSSLHAGHSNLRRQPEETQWV
jgi:hypothetical protein